MISGERQKVKISQKPNYGHDFGVSFLIHCVGLHLIRCRVRSTVGRKGRF